MAGAAEGKEPYRTQLSSVSRAGLRSSKTQLETFFSGPQTHSQCLQYRGDIICFSAASEGGSCQEEGHSVVAAPASVEES